MSSFFFFFIFLLQLHSIPWQHLPGFVWLVPIFKHFVWVSIFFSVTNSILKFFCMVRKWICKKNYKSWTSRAKGIFAILIDLAKLFFNGCCNDLHSHQQHVNRPVFPQPLLQNVCQVNSSLYSECSVRLLLYPIILCIINSIRKGRHSWDGLPCGKRWVSKCVSKVMDVNDMSAVLPPYLT